MKNLQYLATEIFPKENEIGCKKQKQKQKTKSVTQRVVYI